MLPSFLHNCSERVSELCVLLSMTFKTKSLFIDICICVNYIKLFLDTRAIYNTYITYTYLWFFFLIAFT